MLVKICGLKYSENILNVLDLQPDMIGFIFYPNSPRYAEELDIKLLTQISYGIKKIGVFVNEDLETILTTAQRYNLDGVQLHGNELVDLCSTIKEAGYLVIKAFSILDKYNFRVTCKYRDVSNYFLFDTRTDFYGGSGKKFDWGLLQEYQGETPFLLSGGIAPDDVQTITQINHPKMIGVDINSKFEITPGLKNITLLKDFVNAVR